MAGAMLKLSTGLAESSLTSGLLAGTLLGSAGIIEKMARRVTRGPHAAAAAPAPPEPGGDAAAAVPDLAALESLAPGPGFRFETARDFARAYREGRTSPLQVAEHVLERTRESEERAPAMRSSSRSSATTCLAQAHEATERWQHGKPLSPLDGVPVAVKDEIRPARLTRPPSARGSCGKEPAAEDAGAWPRAAPRRRGADSARPTCTRVEIGHRRHRPEPRTHGFGRPNRLRIRGACTGRLLEAGPDRLRGAGLCPVAVRRRTVAAPSGIPASFCGRRGASSPPSGA